MLPPCRHRRPHRQRSRRQRRPQQQPQSRTSETVLTAEAVLMAEAMVKVVSWRSERRQNTHRSHWARWRSQRPERSSSIHTAHTTHKGPAPRNSRPEGKRAEKVGTAMAAEAMVKVVSWRSARRQNMLRSHWARWRSQRPERSSSIHTAHTTHKGRVPRNSRPEGEGAEEAGTAMAVEAMVALAQRTCFPHRKRTRPAPSALKLPRGGRWQREPYPPPCCRGSNRRSWVDAT